MSRQDNAGRSAGEHTTSYYAASANPSPERPSLKGDLTVDILVVGAGYSGLSTALHLAEKGYKVAIIEAARVGWGASGRNGGQIVNGLNASLQTIKKRYGADTANFVAGLVQEGGEIIRERIKTYDIQCDLMSKSFHFCIIKCKVKESLHLHDKLFHTLFTCSTYGLVCTYIYSFYTIKVMKRFKKLYHLDSRTVRVGDDP